MRAKITKSAVDRMQPWSVLWDSEVKGFGIRRHGTEGRHYLLRYRFNGRQTFRKIGRHGSPFTPDTARAEALRLLGQIVSGVNPATAARKGDTFAGEVDRFLDHKRRALKPSTFVNFEAHLRKHAAPLHSLALAEIDRRAIAQLLSEVERASGPIARNRVRSSLSSFFTWLIHEGLLDVNSVKATAKTNEVSRDRVLSATELAAVWRALAQDEVGDIIRLLLLTGQRKDEIAGLRWSEIEWDRALIVLPPERTKNGLRHEVPLAPMALEMLRRRFQLGDRAEGNDARVFAKLSWGHAKERLDKSLGDSVKAWRIHDLRRSVATGMCESCGVLPHICEAVLNHQSGSKAGIAGVYQRTKYETEKREALLRWADEVERITSA